MKPRDHSSMAVNMLNRISFDSDSIRSSVRPQTTTKPPRQKMALTAVVSFLQLSLECFVGSTWNQKSSCSVERDPSNCQDFIEIFSSNQLRLADFCSNSADVPVRSWRRGGDGTETEQRIRAVRWTGVPTAIGHWAAHHSTLTMSGNLHKNPQAVNKNLIQLETKIKFSFR